MQDTAKAPNAPANHAAPQSAKSQKPEPTVPLPTDRVSFEKQLQFLRAYAAASNNGAKAVSNEDIAAIVDMKASTVSLANNFFVKNGFLSRSGREYVPAREVLDYKLGYDWDAATGSHKLAPLIERTWFAQGLRPKLELRAIDETEAIGDLAQKINAAPEYRSQIKTLIDYMVAAGIVSREGGQIVLIRRRQETGGESNEEKSAVPHNPQSTTSAQVEDLSQLPFGQVGSIKFSVAINVDMTQMANWEASRITAFFTGLAQVLAAQKGGPKT